MYGCQGKRKQLHTCVFHIQFVKLQTRTSKWLEAKSNQISNVYTLPSCITLCDLKCDNYHKLVLVDIPKDFSSKPKLKVFKGVGVISEQGLPGIPSGVESFYVDEIDRKVPTVAVAIGPSVLFYRNMKPYYKYSIPGLNVEPLEIQIWRKLFVDKPENYGKTIEELKTIDFNQLSWKSQKLLLMPPDQQQNFIKENADSELQKLSNITAMTTLQHISNDDKPRSSLILATEDGEIFIIDTQSFIIIYRAKICPYQSTPNLISAVGQFDTDFRIIISTRERSLCLLRKIWLEGKEILKLDSPALGLKFLPVDQTIVVLCMDGNLSCYSKKGKQLWTVILQDIPKCMTPVHLPHFGMTLIAVALKNGQVQIYSQKYIVDEFKIQDSITAMIFGQMGREEHVLSIITGQGNLLVKILKRTAEFCINQNNQKSNSLAQISKTFEFPKKNSIFLEQIEREKDNFKSIYHNFQSELWRIRLLTSRFAVDAINTSEYKISNGLENSPIRVAAEICGLGPEFRVILTIENISRKIETASDLNIILHCDQRYFTFSKTVSKLPILLPGTPIKIDFEVKAVIDANDLPSVGLNHENSCIKVMIFKSGQNKLILAATITMPQLEKRLEG